MNLHINYWFLQGQVDKFSLHWYWKWELFYLLFGFKAKGIFPTSTRDVLGFHSDINFFLTYWFFASHSGCLWELLIVALLIFNNFWPSTLSHKCFSISNLSYIIDFFFSLFSVVILSKGLDVKDTVAFWSGTITHFLAYFGKFS